MLLLVLFVLPYRIFHRSPAYLHVICTKTSPSDFDSGELLLPGWLGSTSAEHLYRCSQPFPSGCRPFHHFDSPEAPKHHLDALES